MTWLDITVYICLAIGLIKGLIDGFVKQLVAVVALVLAFLFSGVAAGYIRDFMQNTLHWGETVNPSAMNAIYYIIAFVLILAILSLVGILATKLINITPAGIFNRIAGGIFGVLLWLFSLSFLLNVVMTFDTESKIINKEIQEKSITYQPVKMAVLAVYPYIREYLGK
jgi:membrane protein required for colicin V production